MVCNILPWETTATTEADPATSMSIRKRKGSDVWHIDFRTPGGGRVRQTAGTTDKKEAQELHDKLKHEAWRVAKMGERPRYTFEQAATRYLLEQSDKADYDDRVAHIRHFLGHFAGRDKEVFIVQQLTNLGELPSKGFKVGFFPLRLARCSASPARVVAFIPV